MIEAFHCVVEPCGALTEIVRRPRESNGRLRERLLPTREQPCEECVEIAEVVVERSLGTFKRRAHAIDGEGRHAFVTQEGEAGVKPVTGSESRVHWRTASAVHTASTKQSGE